MRQRRSTPPLTHERPVSELLFSDPHAAPTTRDRDGAIGQLVGHYWVLLKHYFWIILLTIALGGALAHLWTKEQPRVYEAQSKIIFHANDQSVFGREIERVDFMDPGARWQFDQFWNTQREILGSKKFAERVAQRSGMLDDESLVSLKGGDGATLSAQTRAELGGARIRRSTTISLQRDSRVALIQVRTHDPKLAQRIANAYANVYLEYTREFQSGGLNQMIEWFDNYVSTKRAELEAAQRKLVEFKKDNNILSISYESRQNLTGSNMQLINEQINRVETRLAAEESVLAQIKVMNKGGEDLRTLVELMPNADTLRQAISREALLKEKYAQLRGRGYMDDWREVKAVTEELRVVQENLNADITRIRKGTENRVETLKRERARLKAELDSLTREAFKLDELGLRYEQLKDSAQSLKGLFDAVLKRSEELDINSMYESRNIQILEEAVEPRAPISPKVPVNLAIGIILGLALGVGIIVLIDTLDDTVKREEHVLRYTDRPILGTLPRVNPSLFKNLTQGEGNLSDRLTALAPKSAFAEGVKALRTNVMFISPDDPPRLITVTSPGPGEGKTMLSSNMAIALAQSGLKTLIIDADLRRPRVHKAFEQDNARGLSNLLIDQVPLEELVRDTSVPNLQVLTSGPIPPNPSELLHSPEFRALCALLRERYDRVIFDSPPLGAVSDPLILSRMVDGMMLVLMFGKTRRELLRRSIEQLVTVGAPLMGCVLNNIDTSRANYYGYTYYRYNYEEHPEAPRDASAGSAG